MPFGASMKRILGLMALVCFFSGTAGILACADNVPAELFQPANARQPADIAAPKISHGAIDHKFLERHASFLKRGKEGPIGLLFMGDSITAGWPHSSYWEEYYGQYDAANFGIGGDRTQHVLWRIDNGELDGIAPKVVVLLIGTNNIGDPVEEIIRGVKKVVGQIHQRLPHARLLLLGIFPRGNDARDPMTIRFRAKINAVNTALAMLEDNSKTRYLDIGDQFLDAGGNIPRSIMPDGLHPNDKGYHRWGKAMQPLLKQMMAQ